MTAPIAPQDAGPDPEQVQRDIAKLRAAGRGDLVRRYLEREGVDPTPYLTQDGASGGHHKLGLVGRAIVSGLEGIARAPANLASGAAQLMGRGLGISPDQMAVASQMATRSLPPLFQSGAPVGADQLGLPQPQTPGEKVAVRAGEGAVGALPFAFGGGLLAGASTVASGAAGGAAPQIVENRGGGPKEQLVAGLVAGLATPALMSGGAEAVRRALAGSQAQRAAAQSAQAVLAAATGQDAVTLGQVTEGGAARSLERGLRGKQFGTAGSYRKTLDAQGHGLRSNLQQSVDDLAPIDQANREAAGEAIQRGIEGPRSPGLLGNQQQIDDILANAGPGPATPIIKPVKVSEGYIPRFWDQAGKLYDRAYTAVAPDTPVIPSNTWSWFQRQEQAANGGLIPSLNNPTVQRWGDEFAAALEQSPNGVPFDELKRLRTLIDDRIKSFDPAVAATQGTALKDLMSLRGALSSDIGATVIQRGGRDGAAAWQQAQSYFADGMDKIENIFKPLVVKNTPEKVFQAAMTGTKQGATIIRTTMNELHPEQRRIVLSSILREMMKGPAGEEVSAEALTSSWRKLTPDTRAALTRHLGVEATNGLNNVMKSVEILGKAKAALPNPADAGTGGLFKRVLVGLGLGGPALASAGLMSKGAGLAVAGGAAATELGAHVTASMLTSPKVVRWLLGTTKLPAGVLPSALVQLSQQAAKWPPADRAAAQAVIQQLGGVGMPTGAPAPMVADAASVR